MCCFWASVVGGASLDTGWQPPDSAASAAPQAVGVAPGAPVPPEAVAAARAAVEASRHKYPLLRREEVTSTQSAQPQHPTEHGSRALKARHIAQQNTPNSAPDILNALATLATASVIHSVTAPLPATAAHGNEAVAHDETQATFTWSRDCWSAAYSTPPRSSLSLGEDSYLELPLVTGQRLLGTRREQAEGAPLLRQEGTPKAIELTRVDAPSRTQGWHRPAPLGPQLHALPLDPDLGEPTPDTRIGLVVALRRGVQVSRADGAPDARRDVAPPIPLNLSPRTPGLPSVVVSAVPTVPTLREAGASTRSDVEHQQSIYEKKLPASQEAPPATEKAVGHSVRVVTMLLLFVSLCIVTLAQCCVTATSKHESIAISSETLLNRRVRLLESVAEAALPGQTPPAVPAAAPSRGRAAVSRSPRPSGGRRLS